MQIEAGKYYMTRDGRKAGPMSRDGLRDYPWSSPYFEGVNGDFWNDEGESDETSNNDLIAEWQDDPAVTDYASLAAKHGICITVTVGDASISYDGRD